MRFGMIVGDPHIRCGLRSLLSGSDCPPKKLVTLNIRKFASRGLLDETDLHQFRRTRGTRNGGKHASLRLSLRSAVSGGFDRGVAPRRLVEISIPTPSLPLSFPPSGKGDFPFEMVSSLAEITWRYQRRNLPGHVRLALRLARHHPGAAHLGDSDVALTVMRANYSHGEARVNPRTHLGTSKRLPPCAADERRIIRSKPRGGLALMTRSDFSDTRLEGERAG